jgi:hypothetical protein
MHSRGEVLRGYTPTGYATIVFDAQQANSA